jgi:hypothetical protein
MRIECTPGESTPTAFLWMTRAEAAELRDALDGMLSGPVDPSWHAHVSSGDYGSELTIAWEKGAE